jgi:hypothetical protein
MDASKPCLNSRDLSREYLVNFPITFCQDSSPRHSKKPSPTLWTPRILKHLQSAFHFKTKVIPVSIVTSTLNSISWTITKFITVNSFKPQLSCMEIGCRLFVSLDLRFELTLVYQTSQRNFTTTNGTSSFGFNHSFHASLYSSGLSAAPIISSSSIVA